MIDGGRGGLKDRRKERMDGGGKGRVGKEVG